MHQKIAHADDASVARLMKNLLQAQGVRVLPEPEELGEPDSELDVRVHSDDRTKALSCLETERLERWIVR